MAKTSPKKTPKAGRPTNSTVAPGIFQRGEVYWLRYSAGGEQVRVSLETSDAAEAIKRAEERRGRAVVSKTSGKVKGGKTALDLKLEKYTAEKLKEGVFVGTSAKGASQAVRHFANSMGVSDPNSVTSQMLASYYRKTRATGSEATAQTYCTRVGTFLRWAGLRITTPGFDSEAPARETVIPLEEVSELLEKATGEMKFILMAGFRAGMRRGEITMARPAWFDLAKGSIHIPAKDSVTGWIPKSGRARSIPLVSEFSAFIKSEFPNWKTQRFCIRPEVEQGKWIYRFDFRKMFEGFAKTNCQELTPHVMRHSYASHLANGGVGIAQLAAWTGDRIATLERHYLHLASDAAKAEGAFSGGAEVKKTQQVQNLMLEFLEAQKQDADERLNAARREALAPFAAIMDKAVSEWRKGE